MSFTAIHRIRRSNATPDATQPGCFTIRRIPSKMMNSVAAAQARRPPSSAAGKNAAPTASASVVPDASLPFQVMTAVRKLLMARSSAATSGKSSSCRFQRTILPRFRTTAKAPPRSASPAGTPPAAPPQLVRGQVGHVTDFGVHDDGSVICIAQEGNGVFPVEQQGELPARLQSSKATFAGQCIKNGRKIHGSSLMVTEHDEKRVFLFTPPAGYARRPSVGSCRALPSPSARGRASHSFQ